MRFLILGCLELSVFGLGWARSKQGCFKVVCFDLVLRVLYNNYEPITNPSFSHLTINRTYKGDEADLGHTRKNA